LSVQALHCDGGQRCIKATTDEWSVTPFVDVRIKPEIQLRLSLPIAYHYLVDAQGNTIDPTFTIAGAFSSPISYPRAAEPFVVPLLAPVALLLQVAVAGCAKSVHL